MKTFGQLKTEIRNQIWASGEQENLVSGHDLIFQEAAAEIAKWVDCEKDDNVNLIHFCKTFFKCGMTVVSAPKGIVHRVFTVANKDYCDPVFYRQVEWPGPECWSRNLIKYTIPTNSGLPKLPMGFHQAEASTDAVCGRARTGIWAIHNGNIYIAPWIQSNEYVVIEWSGIKTEWTDDDLVNEAQDYKKAVKLYVQHGHERDYGNAQMAASFKNIQHSGSFDEAIADLMWQCREQTKVRETETCAEERRRFPSEISDDAVPTPEGATIIAQIGNWGDECSTSDDVAQLVRNMGPVAIVSSGNQVPSSIQAIFDLIQSGGDTIFVDFVNRSTGTSLTYDWDFGDGSPHSTEKNPEEHPYGAPGTYTITLTVTNCIGQTSSASQAVSVVTDLCAGVPDNVDDMVWSITKDANTTFTAAGATGSFDLGGPSAPFGLTMIFNPTICNRLTGKSMKIDFLLSYAAYDPGWTFKLEWVDENNVATNIYISPATAFPAVIDLPVSVTIPLADLASNGSRLRIRATQNSQSGLSIDFRGTFTASIV